MVFCRRPDHRFRRVVHRHDWRFLFGLLAERREDGYFIALDARTGKLLWQLRLGGSVHSTPMMYSIAGTQYIAVTGGNNLFVFAVR